MNDLADPALQQPSRRSDAALAGSAILLCGLQQRRYVPLAQGLADFGRFQAQSGNTRETVDSVTRTGYISP